MRLSSQPALRLTQGSSLGLLLVLDLLMMTVMILLSLHKAQEKRDDSQKRDGQKNESRKRKLLTKENAPARACALSRSRSRITRTHASAWNLESRRKCVHRNTRETTVRQFVRSKLPTFRRPLIDRAITERDAFSLGFSHFLSPSGCRSGREVRRFRPARTCRNRRRRRRRGSLFLALPSSRFPASATLAFQEVVFQDSTFPSKFQASLVFW